MSSGWTMEIGFDTGTAPSSLFKSSARPLQMGGLYKVNPDRIEVTGLSSQSGLERGDTLVFYIVDMSAENGDEAMLLDCSVSFFDSSHNTITTSDVITDIPDSVEDMGRLPSQFFGPDLRAYRLHKDAVSQFQVNYPEPARLLMEIRLSVENASMLSPVEFICQQQIFIN